MPSIPYAMAAATLTLTLATIPAPATRSVSTPAVGTATSFHAEAVSVVAAGRVRMTLPAPTGPYPVGTVAVRLVDRSRHDPLVKAKPYRELMVSLWYPAKDTGRSLPVAPHMAPRAAADWGRRSAPPMGIPAGKVDWAATPTHAREGAPVDPRRGRLPVVLFTSGDGGPRTLGTTLVEDLASHGYLVVTVDHTYEADQVEFPGGRLVRALPLPDKLTPRVIDQLLARHARARMADLRFVLDRITALGQGHDLGKEAGKLPEGLSGAPDPARIGVLGQSLGGSVAAQLVRDDRRVDAGVNLDGAYVGNVARTGVAEPFLQFASGTRTRAAEPTWKSFWTASTGWKRELRLAGAAHGSFTDLQALLPQLATALPKVPVADFAGTVDPARSVAAQRAYVGAFFDLHLKRKPTRLFDAPDTRYREVSLVP